MCTLSVLVFPNGIDLVVLQSENPYKVQLGKYVHQINDLIILFSGLTVSASGGSIILNYYNQKRLITSGEQG
jgi:hypothetical protein